MRGVRLTYSGGPTVLIEVEGWRLLTDPTFYAPGRRYSFGWGRRVTQTAFFTRTPRGPSSARRFAADEAGARKVP